MSGASVDRIVRNPFYVLDLRPSATRIEVEREGQKLIGMLGVGLKSAATYKTPLGPRPRDAETVRWAMGELRDPARRLEHELWARLEVGAVPVASPGAAKRAGTSDVGWTGALAALGFREKR